MSPAQYALGLRDFPPLRYAERQGQRVAPSRLVLAHESRGRMPWLICSSDQRVNLATNSDVYCVYPSNHSEMNNPELDFKTCISAYNCLRTMAARIEQSHGSNGGWRNPNKSNPRRGYSLIFPRIVAHHHNRLVVPRDGASLSIWWDSGGNPVAEALEPVMNLLWSVRETLEPRFAECDEKYSCSVDSYMDSLIARGF